MSIHLRPAQLEATLLPPEIAFLRGAIPLATLLKAATLARACGSDAATVALHANLIDEKTFYRMLARRLRTRFLDAPVALSDCSRYPLVLQVGAAPLAQDGHHPLIAAPRGRSVAKLIAACDQEMRAPAITTPSRLRASIFAHHADTIAANASEALMRERPEWSCRPGAQPADLLLAGLIVALCLVAANLPNAFGLAVLAVVQIAVLAMLTVRLCAATVRISTEPAPTLPILPDDALPTYTVMVALYREARVVPRLVYTLSKLAYPEAKLQIMFLLEEDDAETAAALRAVPLPARFEIVVVPDGQPRTKPRALNAALPLARGELLVVYDAEDVIDPMQLRTAASLFANGGARTAALQGRLVIDNVDGLLSRMFAIEYSALFDVLGPALARWRMPYPLGGTSTHFRTRILRELKGWDAWNVTEDADLGIRMALAGYRVADLPSATFEESPKDAPAWLKQRTRWMKGFLQTSFTHGRNPRVFWCRLGVVRGLVAVTLVPGTVVSALLYPILTLLTCGQLLLGGAPPGADWLSRLTSACSLAVCVGGAGAMLIPAALGCWRRRWFGLLPLVPFLPVYFLLLSLAAWLAVFELARFPHRWNKTEHGLSRTSRSGALHLRRKRTCGLTALSSARPRVASAVVRD